MNAKITPRDLNVWGGIACLPLVKNIKTPKAADWKLVSCPVCGMDCWESDLARQEIAKGIASACTMCALKIAAQ